jgi:hypothetical protein
MIPPELLTTRDIRAVHFSSVKYDDAGEGRRFSGLVRLDPDALVVEGAVSFPHTATWVPKLAQRFGIEMKFRGDFSLTIPYADIDRIEVVTGWFTTYERTGLFRQAIELSVKRLSLLKPLPEAAKGVLKLPCSKHDLASAQALASRSQLLTQHHRMTSL